jgi:hypothetical protein
MKGDFSRNTFDSRKHFSRVLMQQGRVQLDADWNEQAAILLHYLQTLAADLTGPHAGPADNLGFEIKPNDEGNFDIGPGRYYVDGILCENDILLDETGNPQPLSYTEQPGHPFDATELESGKNYLVYLDVWERHVTCIEDDSIREVALGGPDTASRAQVVWQVKVTNVMPDGTTGIPDSADEINQNWDQNEWTGTNKWQPLNRGLLKAKAKEDPEKETDPCITPPEARYRGAENQLYRVEIHQEGAAGKATFKWSRDNGSVIFPIEKMIAEFGTAAPGAKTVTDTAQVTLGHLWRDDRFSLQVGNWVEIVDDDYTLQGHAGALWQVDKPVDRNKKLVSLRRTRGASTDPSVAGQSPSKRPYLRRWDHEAGDAIVEGNDDNNWLVLENGVQIQFQPDATYRTGDYWLIPARTAAGDVEWPKDSKGDPIAMPPHGVEHHYAPLAILSVNNKGSVTDCRYQLELIRKPVSQ